MAETTAGPEAESGNRARETALRRFSLWSSKVSLERKLTIALLIAAVSAGMATFAAMTGRIPGDVSSWSILLLLLIDLALLLGLGALIARRLVILRAETKQGLAGARLHARLVALFSLVAVTPTIIVATFAVLFFDFGLQGWFSNRVSTAVKESLAVAEAYLEEHRRTIAADAWALAQDLNREGSLLVLNPKRFNQVLVTQSAIRALTEAAVFSSAGQVLAQSGFSPLSSNYRLEIPEYAMTQAKAGELVILTDRGEDRVRALLRLDGFTDSFLFVGRLIDPRVLAHMDRSRGAFKLYQELEGERSDLQLTFALIFIVVALLLLLTAVWIGLSFANYLTRPIGNLIRATEAVGTGDLTARVDEDELHDEIGPLSRAFNRMTGELERQRAQLLDANREVDDRRRFSEAVLAGVSAGVLGLDKDGKIELSNRRASELLGIPVEDLRGRSLAAVEPVLQELVTRARGRPRKIAQEQITLGQGKGEPRTLFARVAPEVSVGGIVGFVVTFDDISALLSAQRKAAWADVARRIAHEIKNPLTPIQLSAERIKRKYQDEISSDPETFKICTDTIVRHVADIGRMVDEFSSFARMPAPVMTDQSLNELIQQAVFLEQTAHPELRVSPEVPDRPAIISCDQQQIGRALTNVLQNAIEAVEGRCRREGRPLSGEVRVVLISDHGGTAIQVLDDGPGLPKTDRHKLTEPYVTHRERGTGLGLAIVKKIMEDHRGDLLLEDRPEGGACVSLIFPAAEEDPPGAKRANRKVETVSADGA